MYILWSNDRFRLNESLLVTFTRTMPSILSPFPMFLRPFYKIKLYICLWNCYARFVCSFQKETNPEKYSHNITHNKERLQAQGLTVDVGLWCRKTSPQCCDEWQRRGIMSQPNIHFLPIHYSYSHHWIPIPSLTESSKKH